MALGGLSGSHKWKAWKQLAREYNGSGTGLACRLPWFYPQLPYNSPIWSITRETPLMPPKEPHKHHWPGPKPKLKENKWMQVLHSRRDGSMSRGERVKQQFWAVTGVTPEHEPAASRAWCGPQTNNNANYWNIQSPNPWNSGTSEACDKDSFRSKFRPCLTPGSR